LRDELLVLPLGHVLVDAALEQRAMRAGIDDRRPEPAQVRDGAVDDVDALGVRDREQILVHVLADDADPIAVCS
jgi:hypothetical protein